MPKVKLGRTTIVNPVKQLEIFNMFVRIGMARKGYKTQEQLAACLGMDRSVLNKRISSGRWKYDELCRLFRVLEFSPEEVSQMMGVA